MTAAAIYGGRCPVLCAPCRPWRCHLWGSAEILELPAPAPDRNGTAAPCCIFNPLLTALEDAGGEDGD